MQNAIIMLGALVGVVLGGWLATLLFYHPGDSDLVVTAFLGAIPGIFVGGWIGLKFSSG
jgi:hypothetical protein